MKILLFYPLVLGLANCVFSVWFVRVLDGWLHHGLCYEEAFDTTLLVPVTHEHRFLQGAAFQLAMSCNLTPTNCPAPSGCKGEEKMENPRLETIEGLPRGWGFFSLLAPLWACGILNSEQE